MNKYRVVTIGDAFQDLFVFSSDFKVITDKSFRSGKSLSFDWGAKNNIDDLYYSIGGSAVNSALAFSKLNLNCGIACFLGDDLVGEKIKDKLNSQNVDFLGNTFEGETNTSIILSCRGDRTILSYHGKADYGELEINKKIKTNWFYLAPIGNDFERLENKVIENIAKNGSGLIWNPGQTQIKKQISSYRHLLHLCNIIILNKEEAAVFSGCGKVEDSMKKIHQSGALLVIVTDGSNGSYAFDGQIFYKIKVSDDERVDATGAGDAFASTFAAVIINSCNEKTAGYLPEREVMVNGLKWAAVNSGSVVSKVGANEGLLEPEEIEKRLEKLVKLEPAVYN